MNNIQKIVALSLLILSANNRIHAGIFDNESYMPFVKAGTLLLGALSLGDSARWGYQLSKEMVNKSDKSIYLNIKCIPTPRPWGKYVGIESTTTPKQAGAIFTCEALFSLACLYTLYRRAS